MYRIIRHKKLMIGVLICFIVYFSYISISIYTYGNRTEVVKADAVMVLGASIWGDEPSPVFKERINHGIWLYKNGYAHKIIFTGGKGVNKQYSEAFVAKQYALKNGVDVNDIYIEAYSTITEENIEYCLKIIKENKMNDIIIVSDPLHMKRAITMAKDKGLIAYSSPTPTSRYKSVKSKINFLAREVVLYIGYKVCMLFN
ncbi:YdcF family protein [Clostridiaceae bacterium M8S5]|nr:YdcF family protein [Clostridiaceae bacterium M8S5]